MKRLVGPPSPNMSNVKRNAFARRKLLRTVDPPPVANARNRRRIEKIKIETARTEETVNGTVIVIVIVVATTATRTRNGTGIATATVNGIGTETMTVGEGNTTDGTITMTAIGPRRTTGTGTTDIGRRSIIRTMIETSGGSIASIGMKTAGRKVGAKGNVPPRRSVMRGVKR